MRFPSYFANSTRLPTYSPIPAPRARDAGSFFPLPPHRSPAEAVPSFEIMRPRPIARSTRLQLGGG